MASPAVGELRDYLREAVSGRSPSFADTARADFEAQLDSEIEEAIDCGVVDENGVDGGSVYYTRWFVRFLFDALAPGFPAPEPTVFPDGEVGLSWHLGRRRMMTIAVSGAGRVAWASLIGSDRQSGTSPLLDGVPTSCEDAIRSLLRVHARAA